MRQGGRAIVVGGGLAGLACARELGASCTLLEAADRLGGLCRTEVIDGFSFDWTGHWLHARDAQMRKLIADRWLAGNRLDVQRRARIYSAGRLDHLSLPVSSPWASPAHHRGLPARLHRRDARPGRRRSCGSGRCATPPSSSSATSATGLARHFMFPYNEKLYTVPCEELSPEWGGRFIPRPSLEEVVQRRDRAFARGRRLQRDLLVSAPGRHRGAGARRRQRSRLRRAALGKASRPSTWRGGGCGSAPARSSATTRWC